jgi:hypothetical protein
MVNMTEGKRDRDRDGDKVRNKEEKERGEKFMR